MNKCDLYTQHLKDGIDEMEATIERLRKEILRLLQERETLKSGNLQLYHELKQPDI